MYFWLINICIVFLLCVFLAGIVIPQILLIAFRRKLFDEPDERKIHHGVVPRLGGIAFKPVVFLSIALVTGINMVLGHPAIFLSLEENAQPLFFVFCSVMVLYLVGIADDLIGVRYRAKFIIQILCGVMLIAGGTWLCDVRGVLGLHRLPFWAGYPLTVLVAVFLINAINLIDGIDGLASGLCSIACVFYGTSFFFLEEYTSAMLSFATLGVLVPFFYYNVFGNSAHNRKIFMGDTGSLTVGMLLCFLSFRLSMCAPSSAGSPNPAVLAFAPLLIPCLDVVRVYLHRVRAGRNPFLPDKNHIHHKLLALGMRQRSAMVTIVSVSTALVLLNILLSRRLDVNWLLVGDIAVWTAANVWLTRLIGRRCGDAGNQSDITNHNHKS